MSKTFSYKGYRGNIEHCLDSYELFGKILFINDLVTYHGEGLKELEASFREAVDDYLILCEEVGKEPQKPFKGSFNVRVGEECHKQVSFAAADNDQSLNDWITDAIKEKLESRTKLEVHIHQEKPSVDIQPTEVFNDELLYSSENKVLIGHH